MPQQLTEEDIKNMSPEQLAELQKQNCIFCHIISGKIPAKKVYEDEHCLAILDINPATKGHLLLFPKEHYMILPQVPEDIIKHLGKTSKNLSKISIKALGATGTNIFIANGAVAGQRAPHLIIHIIPRFEGDNVSCFELPEREIRTEDLNNIQNALAKNLGYNPEKIEQVRAEKKEPVVEKKEQNKKLEEIDLKQLKKMIE
jgi:histidine triad (HIT) family protein